MGVPFPSERGRGSLTYTEIGDYGVRERLVGVRGGQPPPTRSWVGLNWQVPRRGR